MLRKHSMFFSSSTHIAKPCFNFKTPLRHSFWPFSKLIETCDTLFSHFQNHLALATLFSPPFDFKTPRCNPAKPCFHSKRHFRNLRNLVSIPKHPFATLQNLVSIFKSPFATRDTYFQNHLALSRLATPIFKTIWPYCSVRLYVFKTDGDGDIIYS